MLIWESTFAGLLNDVRYHALGLHDDLIRCYQYGRTYYSQTGITDWKYGEEIPQLCGTPPSGSVTVMRPTLLCQLSAAVN